MDKYSLNKQIDSWIKAKYEEEKEDREDEIVDKEIERRNLRD